MLTIEQTRLQVSKTTEAGKKSQLGQFFTPSTTARFMAGLFPDANGCCRLLDAGAGIGSLSDAFLERWLSGKFHFQCVEVEAFEVDGSLHHHLERTLAKYAANFDNFAFAIRGDDFIFAATALPPIFLDTNLG